MRLVSVVISTRSCLANAQLDLGQHVIDLGRCRPDLDRRIDEAGRPDDLLHDGIGMRPLVGPRRGGDVDRLRRQRLELIETQRPVVESRWQTEAVFHQRFLAGTVAAVHAPELRNRDVALVDHE